MSNISETFDPLDVLRDQLRYPPQNLWMNARAISADRQMQTVVIELDFRRELSAHSDEMLFHGGIIASIIDIAGHASVAVWHGGGIAPTIGLQIDYLAPAIGPTLTVRGILRKTGRAIACADVEVQAGSGLVALGRGRFSTRGYRK